MSEYSPQNAADYAAFDSYLNEIAIFDLEPDNLADNIVDETFDAVGDPDLSPTPSESSFDKIMASNALADGSTADMDSDIIPYYLSSGDYNSGRPMSEAEDKIFYDLDEPLTLNFTTRIVAGSTFDIQDSIYPVDDEPTTREFQNWKGNWEEKMRLVQWKRAGKDWEDITQSFKKMQERTGNTRKSILQRAVREIEALGKAITADREGEADRLRDLLFFNTLGEAVRVDFDTSWARVAESMRSHGSHRKWTSHRVKYAWKNGVSEFFPHIQWRQRVISQVMLL